jgi:hypothetical protein
MEFSADDDATALARNEALRRIGRNIILFQDLERILKYLASVQHSSIPLSKAQATYERRTDFIRTRTLGQVAGDVIQKLFANSDPESITPETISEPWFSFSFRVELDPAAVEESRKTLEALIDERNDLVHHLLSRWNVHDADSCHSLAEELNQQRLRIIREIEKYRAHAHTVQEMAKMLQAFTDSEDGKRQFDLAFLQQSRLVALLASVAAEQSRPDGWTLVSIAGDHLQRLLPEEFSRMKAQHGEGSLQRLIVATELFQVLTEPTSNGGSRAVYRLREDSLVI